MPVLIGSLAFSLICGPGLRERESAYLDAKTQQAMESFVQAVNRVIEQQTLVWERTARDWSSEPRRSAAAGRPTPR